MGPKAQPDPAPSKGSVKVPPKPASTTASKVSAPSKAKKYPRSKMALRAIGQMMRLKRGKKPKKKVVKITIPPLTLRKWIPPDQRKKKKRKKVEISPPGPPPTYFVSELARKCLRRKRPKPFVRVTISYPPVSTKEWVPRKRRKRMRKYDKPEGITQKLDISTLGTVWHNFRVLEDRTILVGSYSETYKRYTAKSNGYQTPCNCMVAIAYFKFNKMKNCDKYTLNKILDMGNQLYLTSWYRQEDSTKTKMELCEIYPSFFIDNNKVTMCLKGTKYKGKIYDSSDDTLSLKNAIKTFYNDKYETGIISYLGKHVAFWFSGKSYYLFDPREHTSKGYPWMGTPSKGYCFLMRFKNLDALVNIIEQNIISKENPKFVITPCFVIRIVKFEAEPPEETSAIIKPHCIDFKESSFKLPKKEPPKIEEPPKKEPPVEKVEEEVVDVVDTPDKAFGENEANEEYSPKFFFSETPQQDDKTGKPQPTKSKIPLTRAKAESVTYFTTITSDKKGILRASTHQSDSRVTNLKGKQSMGNAFAALAMLRIHKSRNWFKKMLDDILRLGVTIHSESVKGLGKDQKLRVSTMAKKVKLESREFAPAVEEFTIVGILQSPNSEVFDLLPALKEFFVDNASCIISGPLNLCIWFEDGYYYMFDPNERDKNGNRILKSIQVGSELQVLDYVPGVACVTWYTDLTDLVEVYLHNVENNKRRDPFIISKVEMNDYVELPEEWHFFKPLATGKWILRGRFHQKCRSYDKTSRGNQGTAMAVTALAFSKIKDVKRWDTDDIDSILHRGNALYETCIAGLKKNKKYLSPLLLVNDLERKFVMEGREINLDMQDCTVNGMLESKDDNDVYNLKKGIQAFFKDNESGIVTARSIAVAVWKTSGIYYYFDSHSRNENGLKNNFGTACVMRFLNSDDMAAAIEANLDPSLEFYFNISRVDPAIWDIQDTGVCPPLNHYTKLGPITAILRSVLHEKSPFFELNAGFQAVPMCLVAFGMSKLYPSAIWWRDILDEVLKIGDKLFTDTMVAREIKPNIPVKEDIDQVYADNCLLDYQIALNQFSLKYARTLEGLFETDFDRLMKNYFTSPKRPGVVDEDQKELLVTSDPYTVSVWIDDDLYYLFDPRPRDGGGQVMGKEEWSTKTEEMEEDEGEDLDFPAYQDYLNRMNEEEENETGEGSPNRRSVASQATEEPATPVVEKHSAHYWREQEFQNGKACIMRFGTLEKLIEHIFENIPPTKRENIKFKLYPVLVTNKSLLRNLYDPNNVATYIDYYSGNWNYFREIEYGRWILSGTINFTHIMFPSYNRGKQAIAICFTALAYAKRYAVSEFKDITVNDILKYGDRLHTATRKVYYKELKKGQGAKLCEGEMEELLNKQSYGINDIAKNFCIGPDQMQLTIAPEIMAGDINAQGMDNLYDVKQALNDYFANNIYGILVSKNLVVAVWRGAKVYYMFDPNACGPNGVACTDGEACITRYLDLQVLADVFVKNLVKEGKNFFFIHQISIRIVRCPRDPKPEEKVRSPRPKFNPYNMVSPGKCLLRGNMNLDDPRFGRGKSVQCAPIAVIALTMTLVHKASLWTKPIIDDILILGDELYTATLDTLGFEFNPWEQGMTLHLVNKDYKVGMLRASCELRTMDQRGIIEIKHPKILNLRQGIEKFFQENTHGVIETEVCTVAIWEEDEEPGILYMFDPYSRGPAAMAAPGGTACVVTFETPLMAAEHFIANITDRTKRSGEFVITPVEIVVGNVRTKPKKLKQKEDPCGKKESTTSVKKPSPKPGEKKKIRKMAEEEHKKKEAHRLSKIGKFEYHVLSGGDAILRGSKSHTSKDFSEYSRGKQDIPNCFAAFVVNRLVVIPHWYYKHIDMALDVGDQLYKDSYITYNPRDPMLGFANILRRVYIKGVRVSLRVYKPVMTNTLNQFNLEMALLNYFQQEQFGIISACEQHVAVFFKEGLYYMFDPHDRDAEGNKVECGCACVMRFQTIPPLVTKFITNVTSPDESMGYFTITLITVGNIAKDGESSPAVT